jgi:hypothetical protein
VSYVHLSVYRSIAQMANVRIHRLDDLGVGQM